MKNKNSLLIAIGAILSSTSFAQDNLQVASDLKHVTVFTSSAELSHEASVNLPVGSSEIIFTHVAADIDENTIQIGSTSSVSILSIRAAKHSSSQPVKSKEYIEIETVFKKEKNKLTGLENAKETEESVLKLLENNQKIASQNTGTTVAELIKMTEYYQPKYLSVKNSISKIEEQIEMQTAVVQLAQSQLEELKGQTSSAGGQLVVQVMNSSAGVKPFKMSYLASGAGWSAAYDVRATDVKKPLQIIYKANVFQNTGVDWSQVQLRLSTGTPSQGGALPTLEPWHLYYKQPFANYGGERSAQLLNEVTIVANTKISAPMAKRAFPKVVQTENQMHTTFDTDVPYTIVSNNKMHAVNLREYETPVIFNYITTPRLDQGVYLTAELTDYERYNLIPGESNIFVENTIVGKTFLDPTNTSDTLLLSMGRDKLLQVKRELVDEYSQNKTFGNYVTQRYTYKIRLKNNKKTPVSIKLNDQYPLSTDKTMEIELLEKDGADENSETGTLSWNVDMEPGETKTVEFSYSIKYPKNKNISHF